MTKQKYVLNKDEIIVYKVSCVRHGFWGAYTNVLVVTNQSVILEKYGLFNNFKGIIRYNYDKISQAIQGEASNGEKQLEIYINGKVEDFALQSSDYEELKVLIRAINDQMNNSYNNYEFYKDIYDKVKDNKRLNELEKKADIDNNLTSYSKDNLSITTNAVKNIIKSKDFSLNGISKGIKKAKRKNDKKIFLNEVADDLAEVTGLHDIQDEFTEIGNDFRELLGLKKKMTNSEKKELIKLKEKMKKKRLEDENNKIIYKDLKEENKKSDIKFINEQLDALKKAKELLDEGILSQEEFEKKKIDILNQ